jgi:AraC-like DNA-binding protein
MASVITKGEQNLSLLTSLLPANERFYMWCYDQEGKLLGTSCPEEYRQTLDRALHILGAFEKMQAYGSDPKRTMPVIIGSAIDMQWAAVMDQGRTGSVVLLLGPVFYVSPDRNRILGALSSFSDRMDGRGFIRGFMQALPDLPVLSYAIFSRYAIMVHNTVNEQQLSITDLDRGLTDKDVQASPADVRDRSQIYRAEKAMLQMVREGNINYQGVFQNSAALSPGVPVHGKDPLRQARTSVIVFTSLVCRAAMEGGLSPEVAYSLGDSYIQACEDCRDSGELSALAHAMYHDFIHKVHQLHVSPGMSHAIQKCCDYIEMNLGARIRASDLAALVGYTEYYLTVKFKKETGMSVSSYVRAARVERAKLMLRSGDLSVKEIAEALAFNTPGYFIQNFREVTGLTPAEYRKKVREDKTDTQL